MTSKIINMRDLSKKDKKEQELLLELIDMLNEMLPDVGVEIEKYENKRAKERFRVKLHVSDDVIETEELTFIQLNLYLTGVMLGYAIKEDE